MHKTSTGEDTSGKAINGSGNKVGPGVMLKVMSGDKLYLRVSSWYKLNGQTLQSSSNPLNELITA